MYVGGLVFPASFMHKKDKDGKAVMAGEPRDLFTEANFRKFERSWDDGRIQTAFFRGEISLNSDTLLIEYDLSHMMHSTFPTGTATGGGTTIHTNQRLMVAHLGHIWKDDPEKGGDVPFVDAAIVGWNMRDKKTADGPMTFLRPKNFDFDAGKHHFTPIYEQSKYKYLIYVDGHCAACRYGFMMRLGSVILKVRSANVRTSISIDNGRPTRNLPSTAQVAPRQVADTMWYFPLLQPYVDHVPVKADLSDLEEKIRWCRQNDDKCRQIGENAKIFYERHVARCVSIN